MCVCAKIVPLEGLRPIAAPVAVPVTCHRWDVAGGDLRRRILRRHRGPGRRRGRSRAVVPVMPSVGTVERTPPLPRVLVCAVMAGPRRGPERAKPGPDSLAAARLDMLRAHEADLVDQRTRAAFDAPEARGGGGARSATCCAHWRRFETKPSARTGATRAHQGAPPPSLVARVDPGVRTLGLCQTRATRCRCRRRRRR